MKEDFFLIQLLKLSTVKIVQGVSLPLPYFPGKKKKNPNKLDKLTEKLGRNEWRGNSKHWRLINRVRKQNKKRKKKVSFNQEETELHGYSNIWKGGK